MDNIQNRNGVDCFAFTGPRKAIWHKKGQSADLANVAQMTPEEAKAWWRKASGHDFEVVKAPAIAAFNGPEFDHMAPDQRFVDTEYFFLARKDDGHIFAPVTKTYQPVQPQAIDDFGDEYVGFDDRFIKDAAGALGDGEKIWTTWRFRDDATVAGDKIEQRLLASTSYDATMASRFEATTTRVVCQNTLRAAWASAEAVIKVTHRSKLNADRVREQLARIVASFDKFKAMGDAMALRTVTEQETAVFIRNLLDIPLDAQRKDISTRSYNIVGDLQRAMRTTLSERNTRDPDLWCLLNGVTRYVDHDRSVRTDGGARDEHAARFDAATWGAGDALKGKAISLLVPMLPDRVKALA